MPNSLKIIFLVVCLSLSGCKGPPVPPEVRQAEIQEHNLWRAYAFLYAPDDYSRYKIYYRDAKDKLINENAKLVWFRDYKLVRVAFSNILTDGERILEKVRRQKEIRSHNVASQLLSYRDKINTLKKIALNINEGRFAKGCLMRAELMLMEAELLYQKEDYNAVEERINGADAYARCAENIVHSILHRYTDETQIAQWRKWVEDTLSESRSKGIAVIVVSKIDRNLTIYKKGEPLAAYEIGLGRNGLTNKLYAGDKATPEGRYGIIKKLTTSRFHKALLIDYPNEEDRKQFYVAKKRGFLPPKAGIGDLIEIHGGGKDYMTDGCISLENEDMDEIFNIVDVGTPVIIVGAIDSTNTILTLLKEL